MGSLEPRIRAIGEDLFRRTKGKKPGVFDKAWWSGQILEWAMRDPGFKTEMFRFVDVFPVLDSPDEVGRHIQEYLLRPGLKVPTALKVALKGASLGRLPMRVAAGQIAKNLEGMGRNFIAGVTPAEAVKPLRDLRKQGLGFTVDLLGEAVVSDAEAADYVARYHDLIGTLAAEAKGWKDDPRLDRDDRGPIPRVNVSVKVSAMDNHLDALDFEASVERAARRLVPLFVAAREAGAFVNLDLEQRSLRDLTFAVFERVLEDPRLEGFEDAGVVVQAYLRDAEADVQRIIDWARRAGRRVTVRLVKGAYWDYEIVQAAQQGWPAPVWRDKADTDACYERCATLLLSNHAHVRTAIGSHNVRSIAHAIATAEAHDVPIEGYEIQCLYGMAEPVKAACVDRGHRVRVYAPVGELIPGMAYLVRRLLENTSNESWLRQGFVDGAAMDALLAPPKPVERDAQVRAVPGPRTDVDDPAPFANEPPRDFAEAAARRAFATALRDVPLGTRLHAIVGGAAVEGGEVLETVDPTDGETVVASVTLAGVDDADRAVRAAKAAWPAWRDRPARERAGLLFELAARMRAERDALSALMVREVGKTWREADADTCEAIDFCEYYGREMLRLAEPRLMQRLPGEANHLSYQGRGVTAVIAPWNFPLAIFTGMTTAALVTGNCVVAKPAEQSMAIAARLVQLAHAAGVPTDVLHFLPGRGETVGARLVEHEDVANIAFTGSLEVGLGIWRAAGVTHPGQPALKRVVCEMGGKNCVIVDSDADLDEAVAGVVHSAFGFAGQKCSACSRVVVLAAHYDAFLARLVEAARSLHVGDPKAPGTQMGPVVEAEARARLEGAIEAGRKRARLALGGAWEGAGHFVMPHVFADVAPDDPLAQDELFGPVVAVVKAEDFDEALRIANGTKYALTGGLFSRSPKHIERARAELRVGNLYINRGITGAVVGRQPFGGFAMSGGGTKAGGPDYLLNFLDPRCVTENTQRRGFAPDLEA
ncbi:MAG: bifunctional proline dehydrogenase/L-glutamate gamma-semialdehyde dehydrogenase [Myxococcales bacterium]|nr:bifunctional proline dehydrogenase/L-glutamate gamma-semialdehyde dehydrogenase [Myxococcales bacterium]